MARIILINMAGLANREEHYSMGQSLKSLRLNIFFSVKSPDLQSHFALHDISDGYMVRSGEWGVPYCQLPDQFSFGPSSEDRVEALAQKADLAVGNHFGDHVDRREATSKEFRKERADHAARTLIDIGVYAGARMHESGYILAIGYSLDAALRSHGISAAESNFKSSREMKVIEIGFKEDDPWSIRVDRSIT